MDDQPVTSVGCPVDSVYSEAIALGLIPIGFFIIVLDDVARPKQFRAPSVSIFDHRRALDCDCSSITQPDWGQLQTRRVVPLATRRVHVLDAR
jgi:hypothetical protein